MNIRKHIPNTITSMNLLSGTLGVIMTFQGHLDWAFYLMIAAAVFDFCDGLSARMLGAYSPMGKELDSLADMVSFGVLPSMMLYKYMDANTGFGFLMYLPLMIAVFSGLRLAKFNIDERQTENFIGLATPSCAMICASMMCYVSHEPDSIIAAIAQAKWFLPVMSVILALLLVSEIPMFGMKIKKSEGTAKKIEWRGYNLLRLIFAICFAASVIVTIALHTHWSLIIFLTFICYLIINILHWLIKSIIKK